VSPENPDGVVGFDRPRVLLWRDDVACSDFAAALSLVGLQTEPNDLGVTLSKTGSDAA